MKKGRKLDVKDSWAKEKRESHFNGKIAVSINIRYVFTE